MKRLSTPRVNRGTLSEKPGGSDPDRIRAGFIAGVGFLVAVGLTAGWHYHRAGRSSGNLAGTAMQAGVVTLSAGTLAVLGNMELPIEIRFYALLDSASASDSVTVFAGRVDRLIGAYQQAAGGKITIVRYKSRLDRNAAAMAAVDGMKPFNLERGDACYLGLVLVRGDRKELLPRLSPDWEQALEPDLSRAIGRLMDRAPAGTAAASPPRVDPAVLAEVKRRVPNFAALSMEEGTRILRESALNDFKATVNEMENEIKQAEGRLGQFQNDQSDAARHADLENLRQLQARQAGKLKEIAARSLAEIEALRQLKEGAR